MSQSSHPRILVVDDEPLNVELLEAYLSSEYEIISAYGGVEALELITKERFDLVLLDVMMPDINGYEVCEKIKNSTFSQFIPVILVTALSGKEDRLKGIKAHADDFLTKPVDRLELSMRVNSLLRIKSLHDNVVFERDQAQNYLDVAGVMMIALDEDEKVTLVNKRALEILGYDEDHILGKDWFDNFVPVEKRGACKSNFSNILLSNTSDVVHYESPVLCKDGSEKIISWNTKVLKNRDGDCVGILCSGEDVTRRRENEAKLREYAENLRSSNELKDLFLDILSHDLLNPLGVAKGFSDLLLDTEENKEKGHKLEIIDESISQVIDMVESAASYARLENITHIDFKRMNICDTLNEVTSAFTSQLASRNIDLDIRIDRSCTAKMNPMISAVFTNFISNAIKYGPSDSTIILEADDLNDMWKLKVIDFGSGIPDSDKELIFHRFKRLEQEHKSVKGFGLGLAIVKRIVELHEGDVGVEDNPYGQGSAFWFTLKKT